MLLPRHLKENMSSTALSSCHQKVQLQSLQDQLGVAKLLSRGSIYQAEILRLGLACGVVLGNSLFYRPDTCTPLQCHGGLEIKSTVDVDNHLKFPCISLLHILQ